MKRVTFGNILESGKISIEEFKSKYWGKKPLLIKGAVKQPGLAFSKEQFIAEFENPASKWKWHPMPSDLPTNEEIFKLSENEDVFERANITDSQVRLKLLKEKYYFYCQPDKEIPKSMCSFISSIQNTLNSPTENYTTTLFYSVNGVGHTDEHSDGYENFVLQLYGSKKWILGTEQSDFKLTVMEKTKNEFYCTDSVQFRRILQKSEVVKNRIEIVTEPGDFLYVPSYTTHEVISDNEFNILMSVFRDPLQMVDSFTKHVQEQDYELNEKLNARLILPNDLSQIKNTVVSHLKTILKSANSMNPKAFGRLAREVSNTNLKDYSTAHLDASNNSTKIKSRNLSISTKLVRNPIYSSHFLNEDGLIHIYINGELMTFDLDKYKKIGLFIKGDAPFSGEDVLEEKTQKNDSDWDQLKVYFRELMTKGYLIAA